MHWEMVIGLEVHVRLNTQTKMFCSCRTHFGQKANTSTCPVCQGLPGALPVFNRAALTRAVKAGLASNCTVNTFSKFDRKNYFYPDMPKAYQITQLEYPICSNGYVTIEVEKSDGSLYEKKVGITRIHMEEDAGKLVHAESPGNSESGVDLNRAGTPLIEIVSEPDIRSSSEAIAFLQKLRILMLTLDVSDCNMEEGSFRCDANISLRPHGSEQFGNRTEIKNMNSFKKIKAAIEYEFKRQRRLLEKGEQIVTETLLFDSETEQTKSMRSKEEAHDYRYFPEPDLVPVIISEEFIQTEADKMPEMPDVKLKRFINEYGITAKDGRTLANDRLLCQYYEEALKECPKEPKKLSNWICTEILSALNEKQISIKEFPLSAAHVGGLIALITDGTISGKIAKEIFPEMIEKQSSAEAIIKERGIELVSDDTQIRRLAEDLIKNNPKPAEDYKSGNQKAAGFFVGQIMKQTQGQANPQIVNKVIKQLLGG